jgi:two-component system LytT family response regulator
MRIDKSFSGCDFILISGKRNIIKLDLAEIVFIQADVNYSQLVDTNNKTYTLCKTIGSLEEVVGKNRFFRCHKSYLINLSRVKAIENSPMALLMDNGTSIPVSKRKRKEFLSVYCHGFVFTGDIMPVSEQHNLVVLN